jgi:hypothetical protein
MTFLILISSFVFNNWVNADVPTSFLPLRSYCSGATVFYCPPIGGGKLVQRISHIEIERFSFQKIQNVLSKDLGRSGWKVEHTAGEVCWSHTGPPDNQEDKIVLSTYFALGKMRIQVVQSSYLTASEVRAFEERHPDANLMNKTYRMQIRPRQAINSRRANYS